jgi:hypothetical protein
MLSCAGDDNPLFLQPAAVICGVLSREEDQMAEFSNLGDEPGKTEQGAHSGMNMAVHGKRARGGKADMDEDHEHDATGGRVKLARGGTDSSLSDTGAHDKRKKGNLYNAQGSPEMAEATDETPGFTKGGRAKRKDGGLAMGGLARPRMDHAKRASGGSARTPYSSGSSLSPPADDRPGRGYEGGKPA